MSASTVAEILSQMAENASRRQMYRGAVIGNTISQASQVPAQFIEDRRRQAVVDLEQAQRAQQLKYAGNADARAQQSHDLEMQGNAAELEQRKVLALGVAAGFGESQDPKDFDLPRAVGVITAAGHPELATKLAQFHEQLLPKITQQDPKKDTYVGGVLTKPGVEPLKTEPHDLAVLAQNPNPFVRTLADSALTRLERPKGAGTVHDTPNGLVRINPDNSVTPLGVQGYHPPKPVVNVNGTGAAGGLEQDAVDYTATQYRILGPQGIPTRIGEVDKTRILNAAAKQAKALGQSPAQAVQRQAAYKSDAASLTKITNMASAAEAFETKAIAQAELVRSLSQKVSRTDWPIVNGALLSGKELTGDTDTHLFANGLLTFTTEYAKLMEGSTGSAAGSSEGARRDAAKLISTALKKGTIDKTLDQMQWEMRQTREGYRATIDHITERMGGTQPATTPAAPAPTGGGMVEAIDPQGNVHHAPAGTPLPAGWKLKD